MGKASRLYAFGFNAFRQLGDNERDLCRQSSITEILHATWESTFALTENGELQVWGYQPWHNSTPKQNVRRVFGDPNSVFGLVDDEGRVWCYTPEHELGQIASEAQDAVCCPARSEIYVLLESRKVDCYLYDQGRFKKAPMDSLPPVYAMAASYTHVLFYVAGQDPIYARGSNRFSQLGIEAAQDVACAPVEFFSGLLDPSVSGNVSCGLFHSAVVLAGELYTFGWKKDGRLGWGNEAAADDVISTPVFLDEHNEEVQVEIVKVACGGAHTIALDDQGRLWTCGSNQYGQLGRPTKDNHDNVFRLCTKCNGKVVDCYAGRWSTFVWVEA